MDRFANARRLSARLVPVLTLVLAGLGLVMLWIGAIAVFDRQELASLAAIGTGMAVGPAGPLQAVLLFILMAGQTALLARALWLLRQAVSRIAGGYTLSPDLAALIHESGRWFVAATLALIAAQPLASLILSIGRTPGFLSIGVTTAHVLALVLAGVLMLFAHLLADAADIDAENREII